jgi:hypothetical protein
MRRLYTRGWHFVKPPLGHEGLRVRRRTLLGARLGSRRLRGSETPLKTLIPQGSTKCQPLVLPFRKFALQAAVLNFEFLF